MMRARLKKNNKGIVALFDAIMFFMIMLVLSTAFLFFSALSVDNADAYIRKEMIIYTEEASTTLMGSTLPDVYYNTTLQNGTDITILRDHGNTMVEYLLLEELDLLDDGVSQSGFIDGYEGKINDLADTLISVRFHYAIHATYTNGTSGDQHSIFLSDVDNMSAASIPGDEVITQNWEQSMLHPGKIGKVQIRFILWRAW